MTRGVLPILLSAILTAGSMPLSYASSEPQLNFKIYSPDAAASTTTPADETKSAESTDPASGTTSSGTTVGTSSETSEKAAEQPAANDEILKKETPMAAPVPTATTEPAAETSTPTATSTPAETPAAAAETATTPAATSTTTETTPAATTAADTATPAATTEATTTTGETKADATAEAGAGEGDKKVLQGYIRVVPIGTKVPIIMDTAVDSDTSQEGDEFAARTSEDLTIDGTVVVPAGSIIKGRIATLNAPKHLNRSGSVALKFDTVTTPDNRQIPLVANLVAHGGVVHARRGMKDIAIDSSMVMAPALVGVLIGLLAGSNNTNSSTTTTSTGTTTSSSKINKGEGAMIGAGVGLALGVAILLAKKGKKVDVRPGDELKIQLAEDLRMPMM